MNFEEFNYLQSQINDLQSRVAHTEQSVVWLQQKICPSEPTVNGSCKSYIYCDTNQEKP